jgi:AcrR family transcriptional regulator
MEAATRPRELSGEKAQRIIEAMRASVGARGVAGSTFDHVAREAGVSRGLLHYYFGTKERLLVEVVRRDCDIRMEVLGAALSGAQSADDLLAAMVRSLEELVEENPAFMALLFELFTLARRNEEVGVEMTELLRRTREHVAALLEAKQEEGVVRLAAPAEAVATVLFAVADGLALRMIAVPERDHGDALRAAEHAVRSLLTG